MVKAIIFALCFLLISFPSLGCPILEKAEPKVGSTVQGDVSKVILHFSGVVVPDSSDIKILDKDGNNYAADKIIGIDIPIKTVSVSLKPLKSGKYKVIWHMLCDCGSVSPGYYSFTVK